MKKQLTIIAAITLLAGCASTSGVMDAENGTHIISASASPARGGTSGANALAYEEAQKFCAERNGGRAVLVTAKERDVQNSTFGASWNASGGSASGASFAGGRVTVQFRCVR